MRSRIITLIVVTIAVLGGWYIYKQNNSLPGLDSSPSQSEEGSPQTSNAGVKEFTISGGAFYFNPSSIEVNEGDTVKVNFVNAGGVHDLVIDQYGVRTPNLSSGESASFTFVADKAGIFEYYCSVGTHRQMGMKGTLIVK